MSGAKTYPVYRNTTSDGATATEIGDPTGTSYTDTSATPGTTYYYWVEADAGTGSISNPAGPVTGEAQFSPPTGLSATNNLTNEVIVSWNAEAGATTYPVYRNTTNNGGTASYVGDPTGTSFTDTSVTPGTLYYYWVEADNGAGSISNPAGPVTGEAQLSPPTGLSATIGLANEVIVSWNAEAGATTYPVYRNTTNDGSTASYIGDPTGTSFTDTSVTPGTLYYYWVEADNGAGSISNPAGPAEGFADLPAPTGLTPTDLSNGIKLSWTSVAGATSYVIFRNTNPSGSSASNIGSTSNTTYTDTTAASDTTYYYWVEAANSATGISNFPAGPVSEEVLTSVIMGSGAEYTVIGEPGSQTLEVLTGTVTLTSDLSALLPNYSLQIENGASVVLASDQHIGALQLLGSGTLDMSSYSMFINYGSNSDPISAIAGYIKSGYNSGGWNGQGIISVAARTPTNGLYYGLGFADSADANNPAGLSSGQIEVKYTLLGDAKLAATVNGPDLAIVAANFNQSFTGWDQGDFQYDGVVNSPDLAEVAANYNQGDSGASVASSAAVLNVPAASFTSTVTTSTTESTNTKTTAATPITPKSKPVGVSKAVITETTTRKSKASAVTTYAASVVTVPSAGSTATPQNINNKDAKFLEDR
ncbi:MAG: fibronectin type III domain-containing protein [Tepidisphaeraceae bacterium]